jgi:hypothetical protein
MLPFVKFDNYGNARIRFFGAPQAVGWHYARAKLSPLKTVCPNSFDTNKCKFCGNGAMPVSRSMIRVWDCIAKRWAVYVGPHTVFADAWEKSKAVGVTKDEMYFGAGPDVLLQRLGASTEVEVCPETVGQARGKGPLPLLDETMKGIEKASVWNKFGSVEEVERKYGWETQ